MRAFWNILPSLKSRATWRAGPYVWLSILAGCVGLILSLSAAFTVWHRANRLAELELTARASNYDQTLQFGINMYMRRVAALRSLFESPMLCLSLDVASTHRRVAGICPQQADSPRSNGRI